jgi:hypothetical protein
LALGYVLIRDEAVHTEAVFANPDIYAFDAGTSSAGGTLPNQETHCFCPSEDHRSRVARRRLQGHLGARCLIALAVGWRFAAAGGEPVSPADRAIISTIPVRMRPCWA